MNECKNCSAKTDDLDGGRCSWCWQKHRNEFPTPTTEVVHNLFSSIIFNLFRRGDS